VNECKPLQLGSFMDWVNGVDNHSSGRGLHSSTFQLNLSALHGIGGVRKGLCSLC